MLQFMAYLHFLFSFHLIFNLLLMIYVSCCLLNIDTGTGVILCIEKALAESGVAKEDVNYVNAHATSTPAGDLKEYQALIHCFGQNPEVCWLNLGILLHFNKLLNKILQLRVNSTKSMTGHLLGAAGGVEAVAVIQVNQNIVVYLFFFLTL